MIKGHRQIENELDKLANVSKKIDINIERKYTYQTHHVRTQILS